MVYKLGDYRNETHQMSEEVLECDTCNRTSLNSIIHVVPDSLSDRPSGNNHYCEECLKEE